MRHHFLQFFILLLLIVGSPQLYSQFCDFTLKGNVFDLHDNTPIFSALVTIEGTTFLSQTDELGISTRSLYWYLYIIDKTSKV